MTEELQQTLHQYIFHRQGDKNNYRHKRSDTRRPVICPFSSFSFNMLSVASFIAELLSCFTHPSFYICQNLVSYIFNPDQEMLQTFLD